MENTRNVLTKMIKIRWIKTVFDDNHMSLLLFLFCHIIFTNDSEYKYIRDRQNMVIIYLITVVHSIRFELET